LVASKETFLRTIKRNLAGLLALLAMSSVSASPAMAEGLASEGKSLGGLSDKQCVKKVDRVIRRERSNPGFERVIKGKFSRIVVYDDGTVDFACFPDQVIIKVYFNNAGNRRAKADLKNFLRNF
jgi:hypothetical protein